MTTALACIALLGLLVFGLGFAVSMMRGRTDTVAGSSGDPSDPLHKLIRSHGNTTEYAAMLAILIFLVGSRSPETWALWCMGIATASRYSIAVGLIACQTLERPHPLRFIGAIGTYTRRVRALRGTVAQLVGRRESDCQATWSRELPGPPRASGSAC